MECDLVARVVLNDRVVSFLFDPKTLQFTPDDGTTPLSDRELRALAANRGQEVTYTAATPGSGVRALSH